MSPFNLMQLFCHEILFSYHHKYFALDVCAFLEANTVQMHIFATFLLLFCFSGNIKIIKQVYAISGMLVTFLNMPSSASKHARSYGQSKAGKGATDFHGFRTGLQIASCR